MTVMAYVLTVITSAKSDNYFHSAHETVEEAMAEQETILDKLNNPGMPPPQFVRVGRATVRLADIVSTKVTPEDEAPGYNVSVGFA
jgi:hypothetical protein